MYKMSKGTERLTKERKVTVKTDTKNKTHENLAYKIIRYIDLRVIEADDFRENIGVKNDQSIRIETKLIAILN